MAKKIETTVENEVEAEVVAETAETTVEKVSNIVELQNGEKVEFGKSGKVIASYDVPSRTLTFKVVTGEVITYTLTDEEQANLTENQIEHILYARQEKIKSTLAPVKPVLTEEEIKAGRLNVAQKIVKELADLAEGKFVTRPAGTNSVELTPFLKALALVCAYGTVLGPENKPVEVFNFKAEDVPTKVLKPEWKDVADVKVISEVLDFWKSLDKGVKSTEKRNPWIKAQENLILNGTVTV